MDLRNSTTSGLKRSSGPLCNSWCDRVAAGIGCAWITAANCRACVPRVGNMTRVLVRREQDGIHGRGRLDSRNRSVDSSGFVQASRKYPERCLRLGPTGSVWAQKELGGNVSLFSGCCSSVWADRSRVCGAPCCRPSPSSWALSSRPLALGRQPKNWPFSVFSGSDPRNGLQVLPMTALGLRILALEATGRRDILWSTT